GHFSVELSKYGVNAKRPSFMLGFQIECAREQAHCFTRRYRPCSRPNRVAKRTTRKKFSCGLRQKSIQRRFRIPTDRGPEFAEHRSTIECFERGADKFIAGRMR